MTLQIIVRFKNIIHIFCWTVNELILKRDWIVWVTKLHVRNGDWCNLITTVFYVIVWKGIVQLYRACGNYAPVYTISVISTSIYIKLIERS